MNKGFITTSVLVVSVLALAFGIYFINKNENKLGAYTLVVPQGGTGSTYFGSSTLLYGNGINAIKGTSSPTVGFIFASSTGATSTFEGGLRIVQGIQFADRPSCNGTNRLTTDSNGFLNCTTGLVIQTPWTSDINANGYDLQGINTISASSTLTIIEDLSTGKILFGTTSGNVTYIGTTTPTIALQGFNVGTTTYFAYPVGIGTTSPSPLDFAVNGNGLFSGNLVVGGTCINCGSSGGFSGGTTTVTNLIVTNVSTSTFVGGITVESDKLVVDNQTGNVGIGTTTPAKAFSVQGDQLISGNLTLASLIATGTVNIWSGLNASGTLAIGGLANFYGGLLSTASSTILNIANLTGTNLNFTNSTTTSATTTALYVSGPAILAAASTTITGTLSAQAINGAAITGTSLLSTGGVFASGTAAISGVLSLYGGLLSTASSTLLNVSNLTGTNFNFTNSTTTNATTTNLYVSDSTILAGASSTITGTLSAQTINAQTVNAVGSVNASGTASVSGLLSLYNGFISTASSTVTTNLQVGGGLNASSTASIGGLLSLYNGIQSTASSTLLNVSNYTGTNATTTNATSTNFYVSGAFQAIGASSTITNLILVNATTSTWAVTSNSTTSQLIVSKGFGVGVSTTTYGAGVFNATIDVKGTSASSTFANGLSLTGGCFAINGACVGGGTSGNPGGANKQVQFNDSSTFNGNSLFVFDKTLVNVGIGTDTPYAALSVVGPLGVVAQSFAATSSTATTTFAGPVGIGTTTPTIKAPKVIGLAINGSLYVNGSTTVPELTLSGEGMTGIGSSTPKINTLYKENIIKGWVRFKTDGTIAIDEGFNVSSLTDNAVGDWTVNWNIAAQRKYAISVDIQPCVQAYPDFASNQTAGASRVKCLDTGNSAYDGEIATVMVLGSQ